MSDKLTPWTGDPVPREIDDEYVVDPVVIWSGLGIVAVIAIIIAIASASSKTKSVK